MIELTNDTALQIDISTLEKISSTLTKKEIELLIITKEEMQTINKEQRSLDYSTDVLSFPYEDMPLLGSIIISESHVIIHGLLHLLGYDHEVDDGQMREKEKEIIKKFKLPDSLIIRTQG